MAAVIGKHQNDLSFASRPLKVVSWAIPAGTGLTQNTCIATGSEATGHRFKPLAGGARKAAHVSYVS